MNLTKKHTTTAMATSSSASSTTTTTPMADPTQSLLKQARSHEVSIAELSAISSSRVSFSHLFLIPSTYFSIFVQLHNLILINFR
ncbi:hypothetical protein HanPI659440_Chr06g0230931 [Helianthus annuus]|nr:hypothetical protein HanPI659440_Chr06g0230931 [Helianthus annuus]